MREAWDEAVAAEPDPRAWTQAMANAFFEFKEQRSAVAQLWLQALTEAGDDPEIRQVPAAAPARRARLRRRRRPARCQAAGAIPADRDPRAEAGSSSRVGLLSAVAGRLGGLPGGRPRADPRLAARLADVGSTALPVGDTAPKARAPAAAPGALCLMQTRLAASRAPEAESPRLRLPGLSLISDVPLRPTCRSCGGRLRSGTTIAAMSKFVK